MDTLKKTIMDLSDQEIIEQAFKHFENNIDSDIIEVPFFLGQNDDQQYEAYQSAKNRLKHFKQKVVNIINQMKTGEINETFLSIKKYETLYPLIKDQDDFHLFYLIISNYAMHINIIRDRTEKTFGVTKKQNKQYYLMLDRLYKIKKDLTDTMKHYTYEH